MSRDHLPYCEDEGADIYPHLGGAEGRACICFCSRCQSDTEDCICPDCRSVYHNHDRTPDGR